MQLKTRLIFALGCDALLTAFSAFAFAFAYADSAYVRYVAAVLFVVSALSLCFGVRFLKNLPTEE